MTINFMTFNVAGQNDMLRLMEMSGSDKFPQPTSEKAKSRYTEIAAQKIEALLIDQKPDVIALQELYPIHAEKKALCAKIKDLGYILVGEGDLAIAYKLAKFTFIVSKMTDERGALWVDLKDNTTGKVIRVVSDHLRGFSVENQKRINKNKEGLDQINDLTAGINPLTGQNWQSVRQKEGVFQIKKTAPHEGDTSLSHSLAVVQEAAPDLIIYGLDANTTAEYLPQRVHPKRLRKFTEAGFKCDQNDTRPTIIDHALNRPFKYDYVYVRGAENIESATIDADPSDYPNLMSDHLPVIARITFKVSPLVSRSIFSSAINKITSLIQKIFGWLWNLISPAKVATVDFGSYFETYANVNYSYINQHARVWFDLVKSAGMNPEELEKEFNTLSKPLEELLNEKNAKDVFQDAPEIICRYFLQWAALRKLGKKVPKQFDLYATDPKKLIDQCKTEINELIQLQVDQLESDFVAAYIRLSV